MGLDSEPNRTGLPMSYTTRWENTQLGEKLQKVTYPNMGDTFQEFADTFLTVIHGYNEFVRMGGDADFESSAFEPGLFNYASYGFKKFLLDSKFEGRRGIVD